MPEITIRHALTKLPLFAGRHSGLRACLERAVARGTDLTGADLRHANLANAELDGARMKGVRLDHANLSGANLSEASLDGAVFAHAALQNACLCFTALNHCDFTGASFGATDIAGASLDGTRFSTLSAFTLNFRDAEMLRDCQWFTEDGAPCPFSRPPIAITGLLQPVILLDRHVQIGPVTIRMEDWGMEDRAIKDQTVKNQTVKDQTGAKIIPARKTGQALHPFISAMRQPLAGLVQCRAAHRPSQAKY
jgi:uncharacterized protein YjbI with pentapeptide repeats